MIPFVYTPITADNIDQIYTDISKYYNGIDLPYIEKLWGETDVIKTLVENANRLKSTVEIEVKKRSTRKRKKQ